MITAWAHLPNARHIDAVLAHVKQHPDKWTAAYHSTWPAARGAAWGAAWDAARGAARDAAWDAARDAALHAALHAAWDAALHAALHAARVTALHAARALITWDDAGDLLAMPVDAVRLLAECGHHPAVLLLPAVTAFNSSKD